MQRVIDIENRSFDVDACGETTFTSYYQRCAEFFVVGESAGNVMGYIIASPGTTEKSLIVSIAVAPEQRLHGIGRTLVEFIEERLTGLSKKFLELRVRPTNLSGRRFCEKLGFTVASTIPGFYSDGDDALQMEKVLDN